MSKSAGQLVDITCSCGTFVAQLQDVRPRSGTHLRCHCRDCRAGLRVLDPTAQPRHGVHIFQTRPSSFKIVAGYEQLACLTLSPRGLLRWHTQCCNTPIANTLRKPGLPFVGVLTEHADPANAFGPVVCDAFRTMRDGTQKTTGSFTMVTRLAQRMIADRISGAWRETPFFDVETKQPVVEPRLVSPEEKRAAYA